MKIFKYILTGVIAVVIAVACNEGIDPISRVEPGPDEADPVVTISYPFEGAQIRVKEDVAPINIQFQATDDIEIQSISIVLDGNEIANLTDFVDYRRVLTPYVYETLANGDHTLTVTATDLSGKSASAGVSFVKVEPYQPEYPGEIFYMPFDGDVLELLSITEGTTAGNPVFVDGKVGKAISLNAANKAYVLFPSDTVSTVNSFSVSFWVNPDFIDNNTDGGIDGILGFVNFSNVAGFWGNLDWFVENGSNPTGAIIKCHITNGNGGETWIDNVNGVADFFGQWTHHALTYDATAQEFTYYINGVPVATKTAGWSGPLAFEDGGPMVFGTVQFMTDPSLTSGSGAQTWASYLTGDLDEIKIFNLALSPADVETIYNDAM